MTHVIPALKPWRRWRFAMRRTLLSGVDGSLMNMSDARMPDWAEYQRSTAITVRFDGWTTHALMSYVALGVINVL
jgi:hypothetical protein